MSKTITSRTTHEDIRGMLRADGFASLAPRAAEIKDAAGRGCLLWTPDRITTTDGSRIDVRPDAEEARFRATAFGFGS